MRALIFELRAESLAEEGLVALQLPLVGKKALYRIAHEAVHNVLKHARAPEAEIALGLDQSEVVVAVHGQAVRRKVVVCPVDFRVGRSTC